MTSANRAISPSIPLDSFLVARDIIRQEAAALSRLASHLPAELDHAVEMICNCQGSVIASGIGKAGWIAQKVSATMASTGTRSHFLHPAEAFHGDLGRLGPGDVMLVFSNSGETPEILNLLPAIARSGLPLISIVATANNTLARASSIVLEYGRVQEACPLGLAPSTSTTVMLALGDGIALAASQRRGFLATDFARFHPGGNLGKRLSRVDDIMRPIGQCRLARESETLRSIYVRLAGPERRTGAILLVSEDGLLTGIFTDSDLARLLERGQEKHLDGPVGSVMTRNPKSIRSQSSALTAVELLSAHNLSELPVVDHEHHPLGLIDITDVVGLS